MHIGVYIGVYIDIGPFIRPWEPLGGSWGLLEVAGGALVVPGGS